MLKSRSEVKIEKRHSHGRVETKKGKHLVWAAVNLGMGLVVSRASQREDLRERERERERGRTLD